MDINIKLKKYIDERGIYKNMDRHFKSYEQRTSHFRVMHEMLRISKRIKFTLIRLRAPNGGKQGFMSYFDILKNRGCIGLSHFTSDKYLMKQIYRKVVLIINYNEKIIRTIGKMGGEETDSDSK
jgi:hypothetical protein